ncbi:MDR family MFS transporter [Aspergillus puulaauensis]|uniref:Major facilitator superfamily (MFS) profile domain-containing protein n=1 Tax=Aspergillus puulaauensis TaxID=1220207 RepID=A0A7R8ARM0_9EURO|nr:uncharacterized protein APUU_60071A [Aspergillus puulaauensis]BCS27023.1 hypothetical protein APUU_60071A [Aspergillus puulaauensis]
MSSTDETKPAQQPGDSAEAEMDFQPLSPKFWLIMLGVYLSMFLVALDRTIIATAIPAITDEFHAISDIGWYGSAYMLTAASFNPVFGRVYQLYSTKWTFISCIIVFEVGSVICGAAPTSTAFIIGRAIAGIGSAGIFTGSMMIIVALVPLRKRPMLTSISGMIFAVSSVVAPIIGGAFTDDVTWRWCFYINLPIGGFTLVAVLLLFQSQAPPAPQKGIKAQVKRLDPLGVCLFVPSIISLILALEWGGTTYAWSAPTIIGLFVTFAVLFVAFVVLQVFTPETAMIPMRIVLNRSIAGSMLFIFLFTGAMMSIVYYLNIWFQVVKGDSATQAGLSTIPLVLALVIMGILSAAVTQRIGYYVPAMLVAPVLASVGAGLLSTMTPSSNHSYWMGYQVLYGLGNGCGFQTSNLSAQTVLSKADVPIGMALMFFMQQLGGAVFLAVDQNLLSTKLVQRLSNVAGLDAHAIVNTGATDLRKSVPADQLSTVVNAYNYTLSQIFIVAAGLGAAAILGAVAVEWVNIKTVNQNGSDKQSTGGNGSESETEHDLEAGRQETTDKNSASKEKADV